MSRLRQEGLLTVAAGLATELEISHYDSGVLAAAPYGAVKEIAATVDLNKSRCFRNALSKGCGTVCCRSLPLWNRIDKELSTTQNYWLMDCSNRQCLLVCFEYGQSSEAVNVFSRK